MYLILDYTCITESIYLFKIVSVCVCLYVFVRVCAFGIKAKIFFYAVDNFFMYEMLDLLI